MWTDWSQKKYALTKLINYKFKNDNLLKNALVHSSYCYENDMPYTSNNERLEFLGDAIFDAVIGEILYFRCKNCEEGILSKQRAEIVCEKSLLKKADDIGLYKYMFLGKGEAQVSATNRSKALLADAMEAIIGAVFLDGGWDAAKILVEELFKDIIEDSLNGKINRDYKSALQIKLQSDGKYHTIDYMLDDMEGPPHNRIFKISVICDGKKLGIGKGTSKKRAEQQAAKEALKIMNNI